MDFIEERRQWAVLDQADLAAKAKGVIIGRYIEHPYADGVAVYQIVSRTGAMVDIEWLDIGDGWVLPAWDKKTEIPLAKANELLAQRDAMAALFSRTDDWWSNQPYGAVLHYDNGGGRYVRGIVVERDGHRHMLPIALVGRWEPHEIVTRAINGQPQYGPYAKMILDQETFQANATNMVEYPTHRLSGGDPRSDETALSLEPPALTPEQQALVYVASIHDQVMEALTYQRSADPIAQAAEIRRALLTAQSLLQPGKPSDVEVLAEARMLAKEYLLAADEELTTAAQTLKRKIAQAIVTAAED